MVRNMSINRSGSVRFSFVALAICGITSIMGSSGTYMAVSAAAESDMLVDRDSTEHSLISNDSEHILLQTDEIQSKSKLRTTGEKGRDLQTSATKQSLAQAIANGLRVPLSSKQKQKPVPSSQQLQGLKIVPANATPKTRGGSQQSKTRGRSSNIKTVNKKRSNTGKNRNAKKAQKNATNKRSNNQNKKRNSRVSSSNKKRKSNNKKKRANSRNKRTRQSGSNKKRQSGKKNMKQRTTSSSTSSFLHGINNALGGNRGSTGYGGYGSSGKPVVKYPKPEPGWAGSKPVVKYPKPVSGWGGSTHPEPPIIWDGGVHTNSGVSGVLMPCACYEEPPIWGGSTFAGKSGKASSEKEHNCLCLVSGPDIATTFMPTYFPVS